MTITDYVFLFILSALIYLVILNLGLDIMKQECVKLKEFHKFKTGLTESKVTANDMLKVSEAIKRCK